MIDMEQINVFDLLGNDVDPVYETVANLNKGETVVLEDMNLSLNNFGLYELTHESWHECFRNMIECYRFICRILKIRMWNEEG